MDHHFRGDFNSAYEGRKSYLKTMAGFGTHPRLTLPIIIMGVIAIVAITTAIYHAVNPFGDV